MTGKECKSPEVVAVIVRALCKSERDKATRHCKKDATSSLCKRTRKRKTALPALVALEL